MPKKLNAKKQQRLERRYAELQLEPQSFLNRFDLDFDGLLNDEEQAAARDKLSAEIEEEVSLSSRLDDAKLMQGETLHDRFQIVQKIGRGTQGIVYVARDLQSDELVIVKQLRLSHLDAWDSYDAFKREINILARLSHPGLARFICAFEFEQKGRCSSFYVQSLLPGTNLAKRIENAEFFSENQIVSIGTQLLEILDYLHSHTPVILHRDIKPSNLLLDDEGTVFLVDFGAVQFATSSRTLALGTTGYMAPEQIVGSATPQSDLYGLGATLVYLATKRPPHELELEKLQMVWRPLSSLSEHVSDWIDNLIAPEIESRFQCATTARTFVEQKQRTMVPQRIRSDSSLDLIEVFEGKPADANLRVWESVDQFVCTFEKFDGQKPKLTPFVSEIMDSLLKTNNYKTLKKNGGGFSFDSQGKCKVYSRRKILLNRKISEIESEQFDDGDAGLIAVYDSTLFNLDGKPAEPKRTCLIVGLTLSELDWVKKRLLTFLSSHTLYLM